MIAADVLGVRIRIVQFQKLQRQIVRRLSWIVENFGNNQAGLPRTGPERLGRQFAMRKGAKEQPDQNAPRRAEEQHNSSFQSAGNHGECLG